MMRTLLAGSSSVSMTPLRAANGTCVEVQIVTWSPDHCATMARGSIGTGVRAVGDEAALDDEVGIAHALLDVALDDRRVRGVVAVAHHAVGVAVGGPVDVHERRVGRQRGLEVVDDRQLLVLDLDQVDGLLRDLGRERRDGRDGVALVAHVLLAEEVAILHEVAVEDVGHVGVGRDGEHAGERLRLGRVEPRDAAVRHAGELELRVQHAREVQVGRVAAGARDLVRAVCADEAPLLSGRQHCLLESLSERESRSRQLPYASSISCMRLSANSFSSSCATACATCSGLPSRSSHSLWRQPSR